MPLTSGQKGVIALAIVIIVLVVVGAQQGWFSSMTQVEVNLPQSGTPPSPAAPAVVTPPPVVSDLVGLFNADNYLKIAVNGTVVYEGTVDTKPTGANIDWGSQQSVVIKNVKAGDKVGFMVTNVGGPGGFSGVFKWNGKDYKINSQMFASSTSKSTRYANPNANVPSAVPLTGASPVYGYNAGVWGGVANNYAGAEWVWTPGVGADAACEFCTNTYVWTAA